MLKCMSFFPPQTCLELLKSACMLVLLNFSLGKVSPWNPEFRRCFRTLGLGQAGSANSPSITYTGIIVTFWETEVTHSRGINRCLIDFVVLESCCLCKDPFLVHIMRFEAGSTFFMDTTLYAELFFLNVQTTKF